MVSRYEEQLLQWFNENQSNGHVTMTKFDAEYKRVVGEHPRWYNWGPFYRDHGFVGLRQRNSFDYKNGEDFTCVLCGKTEHTHGPRPDKLCDGCWELKTRVEMQPDLARKVLAEMEVRK